MQIFREIHPLKAFLVEKRLSGRTIGFVPTMGALHEGHLSLIHTSRNENSITVCSIFVNPAQFNNPSDLQKYPRTLEKDIQLLENTGCDVLFCPEAGEMYTSEHIVQFDFGQLDKTMEGQFRPGHFSGVALVVSKLFHMVEPTVAYFGQKDWQQFAIIRQLVKDLSFNVILKNVPIIRESDGLAMSSRNMRLTNDQRKRAAILFKSLNESSDLLRKGNSISQVKDFVKKRLESSPDIKLEYFEVADSENLKLLNNVEESVSPILCIAAFVGDVRLIDNLFYTR
jgi:pantoate--beta-alanine ligase